MAVPLGSQGQADFTQPIALMMDCHRRIEHFLDVLSLLVERYGTSILDAQGRRALDTTLNYFRQAAPRHTEDEEQSLFPRMRKSGDPEVIAALAELDRLEADHRQAENVHQRIDEIGGAWLKTGRLRAQDLAELRALVDELHVAYAAHIHLEDESIFRLATQVLDEQSLVAIGDEMKRRRILNPGRVGSRCAERRRQAAEASGD